MTSLKAHRKALHTRKDARLGNERIALQGMLEDQRQAMVHLLDDLSETEARASLVPSLTTVMGLVKHATYVENWWFSHWLAGVPRTELGLPPDVSSSFHLETADTVASVREAFVTACERSRQVLDEHLDLDKRLAWKDTEVTLRYALVHMIQELARHAGHGDILAEQLRASRALP